VGGTQIAFRFTVGHVCSSCTCERRLPGVFLPEHARSAGSIRQKGEPIGGRLVPGDRLPVGYSLLALLHAEWSHLNEH
jgi:hypothetical protein